MLSLGTQFRLAVLTPSFSCIHSASEGADREVLYRAFAAALILSARINKEFGVDEVPQKIRELNAIRLPNVSRLRIWQKGEYLTFQIKKRYSISRQRQLYLAESNGQNILVKFVRRYCPELHSICAELGHAPSLLAYERLPGGWYGVAMEYLEDAVSIIQNEQIPVYFDRWERDLQKLISKFHSHDLVHGDLRGANIICGNDGRIKLVDFDWGGRDDGVSYPTPRLNPELMEGRSLKHLRITKADDLRIYKNTMAKLRS
jgi:serine/threonine protein kinase